MLKAAWGGCAYCGAADRPLQRDCVLAISRGGRYTLDNIAPACGSCNASKGNNEVTGWLRRKRLDESAFLLRHLEIKAAMAMRFPDDLDPLVPENPHQRPHTPVMVPARLDLVGTNTIQKDVAPLDRVGRHRSAEASFSVVLNA